MTDHDPVNHPKHYTTHPSGVECITVTRHMSFNLGNVIKYLWRADEKGAPLEDLKKARWYLDDEIKRREADANLCQDEGGPHHGTPHICITPVVEQPVAGTAQTLKPQWITWRGGLWRGARDTFVEIRCRDSQRKKGPAGYWRWSHGGYDDDILAYRVVETPTEPQWVKWDGGKGPVNASVRVDVELRDKTIMFGVFAGSLGWGKSILYPDRDIVAYRVVG